jgi:metal-responsive CopG/Arc/MetJ family transcriptional regulator
MTTLSLSIDEFTRSEIDTISDEDGVSRSVVIRRLLKQAAWERSWKKTSSQLREKFEELNLNTIDEIEEYLK